ncbi:MAG: cob(I)yrinic acid a,c-diamide adenosyltransferase [Candidatus Limnocylindrales bacterium]|jgi:cob(I)alamin adenosyltransferase
MPEKLERKSVVATRRGDDGTTGLLFGGMRVFKDDPRTEAYGAIDEAVAALGLARAELGLKAGDGTLPLALARLPDLVLRIQRELFVAGAELATAPDGRDRQLPGETRVTAAMVDDLDALLAETEAAIELPREFVVPGETRLSAALELARTAVRRAERRAVAIGRAEPIPGDQVVPYLNRLGDLLWTFARAAEGAESRPATPSRSQPRRQRRG